jgi:hypothetical protein
LGSEEFFDNNTVLLLKKCLYGLKQVVMAFYRKLLAAASKNWAQEKNLLIHASTTDGKEEDWSL